MQAALLVNVGILRSRLIRFDAVTSISYGCAVGSWCCGVVGGRRKRSRGYVRQSVK